jgi:hypothetical protein
MFYHHPILAACIFIVLKVLKSGRQTAATLAFVVPVAGMHNIISFSMQPQVCITLLYNIFRLSVKQK